jgi:hypothetical protein
VVEVHLDFTKLKDAAFGFRKEKMFRLDRDNAFLDFLLNVISSFPLLCIKK